MTYAKTKTAMALAAGLLLLAACSKPAPEQPYDGNASETGAPLDEATPEPMPTMAEVNAAAPVMANDAAVDVPPEPKVAPDAQMQDDADATGMTARVSRDDAPADNDQAPQ